jgi:hypothetical protein
VKNKFDSTKIPKIPVTIETTQYRLTRHDGLMRLGNRANWVEWDDTGRFKAKFDEPEIGRSFILDGHRASYTWLTTEVTGFTVYPDGSIEFKTKNSSYKLDAYEEQTIELDTDIL